MSSCVHGINAYIKKLEAIAEQCGEKKTVKDVETKDEFILCKMRMYMLLEDIKTGVKERHDLMKRRGICHESITKGHEHRQKLAELQISLPKLQQLHKKAMGKRSAKKEKNQDELKNRYEDIRILKKHVDEIREIVESNGANEDAIAPSAQLLGLRDTANARGDPNTARPFTEEEQQALAEMRARDKQIDQQVGEIGSIVERMVPLAQEIGHTAERQKQQADAITAGVEKNREEIERQNEATKELIKYEKSTTTCCQMVLGLLLLCVIGFVFHQLNLG